MKLASGHFSTRKRVNWGIIGCGDVTEIKSGPALQKADGSALVAVMRRDSARAADFARRHGVPRWARLPDYQFVESCLVPLARDGRTPDKVMALSVMFDANGKLL